MIERDNSVAKRWTRAGMRSSKSEFLSAIGAWTAMLLAALFNLLNFNEYPVMRPEIALVAAVLFAIAIVVGLLHKAAPRLSFVFTASLVAIGFGLNGASQMLSLALGLVTLALAWRFDQAMLKIATVAFVTVALFQFGGGLMNRPESTTAENSSTGRADLPPVVHILLDAHLGTQGMAVSPALAQLRGDTIEFYTRRGFRLYDGAFSRHLNTGNSVPFALSFGEAPLATADVQSVEPPRLAYFDRLKKRGYSISSLNVDFIDYCATQPIDTCRTFRRSDLSAAAHFSMSTLDRAKVIGVTLAYMGSLPRSAYDIWRRSVHKLTGKWMPQFTDQTSLYSLSSAQAMRGFTLELAQARNGQAYFAHFLLPHDPFAFTPECAVKPRTEWQGELLYSDIPTREAAYADQVRCAMRQVDAMLAALDQSPDGKNAIVIIHGDHGSRIVSHRPQVSNPDVGTRDYAMAYSTLFAIRAPGIDPAVVPGRMGLEQLIGDFTRSDFTQAPVPGVEKAQVMLADHRLIPTRRVDLPDYGTALTEN